jgi:glycosyltransferase involved in cell wall biosynthesis
VDIEDDRLVDLAGAEMTGQADTRPSVTVIVPTRNRAHLLETALRSLLAQDYPADRYEVVVVDDGSTDGTSSFVEGMARDGTRARLVLVRQSHKNQNTARNRGIAEADNDLLAFLDDDELAPPDWLSRLMDGALRHPEAGCVGGPYRVRFDGVPPRLCARCWPGEGAFDRGGSEGPISDVAGGNMLIRREAIARAGMFDESLQGHGDETEWMIRYGRAGGTIVYLPQAFIWHRRPAALLARIRLIFRVGGAGFRYSTSIGDDAHVASRAAQIPMHIAHAFRRRCSHGLVMAADSAGVLYEWTKLRGRSLIGPAASRGSR